MQYDSYNDTIRTYIVPVVRVCVCIVIGSCLPFLSGEVKNALPMLSLDDVNN